MAKPAATKNGSRNSIATAYAAAKTNAPADPWLKSIAALATAWPSPVGANQTSSDAAPNAIAYSAVLNAEVTSSAEPDVRRRICFKRGGSFSSESPSSW